jgi:hypothetical protein
MRAGPLAPAGRCHQSFESELVGGAAALGNALAGVCIGFDPASV